MPEDREIPPEEAKKWHAVLRQCVLLIVVTICGVVVNLFMADDPSTDDALRGAILAAVGGIAGNLLKGS